MRLMADAALVGMPSVGKSSIIARISAARPKIASYPFTTLVPNLGMVRSKDGSSFVVADVPGLIEGAAEGKGLGHEFLRHIERTAVILHVVDVTGGFEGRDPVNDLEVIDRELAAYAADLAVRPQIVVANKCDMPGTEAAQARLAKAAAERGRPFFAVSAVTGKGLPALVAACSGEVARLRSTITTSEPVELLNEQLERKRRQRDAIVKVTQEQRGVWRVTGDAVERMVIQTDWDNDESITYLQHRFARAGIEEKLKKAGASVGDEVRILDYEFDFEGTAPTQEAPVAEGASIEGGKDLSTTVSDNNEEDI
jgi:GTP-binding protein